MKSIRNTLFALLCISSATANAAVSIYTDRATWAAALETVSTLTTTSTNIALADEVTSVPGSNVYVGTNGVLTFAGSNTGFGFDFAVQTLESGSEFTFDDEENTGNFIEFDNALSVGDIDNHEDDDWGINISGTGASSINAFGIDIRDDNVLTGQTITFNFTGGETEIVDLTTLSIVSSDFFIGVISTTESFVSASYDEDAGEDDIAIANFEFGTAVVPETSTYGALLGLMALGATVLTRRNQK